MFVLPSIAEQFCVFYSLLICSHCFCYWFGVLGEDGAEMSTRHPNTNHGVLRMGIHLQLMGVASRKSEFESVSMLGDFFFWEVGSSVDGQCAGHFSKGVMYCGLRYVSFALIGIFLFLIFSFATSSFVFFLFPQTSWLRNVFSSSIMQIVFSEIFFLQVQPAVTGVSTCEVPKFQGIHINI